MSESSFYRSEARVILFTEPEERLKILTEMMEKMDARKTSIHEVINEISQNAFGENDLTTEEYQEFLKRIYNKLYEIVR